MCRLPHDLRRRSPMYYDDSGVDKGKYYDLQQEELGPACCQYTHPQPLAGSVSFRADDAADDEHVDAPKAKIASAAFDAGDQGEGDETEGKAGVEVEQVVLASSVVGRRITVRQTEKGKPKEGIIESFDSKSGKHVVKFDDGDTKSYDFKADATRETWPDRFVFDGAESYLRGPHPFDEATPIGWHVHCSHDERWKYGELVGRNSDSLILDLKLDYEVDAVSGGSGSGGSGGSGGNGGSGGSESGLDRGDYLALTARRLFRMDSSMFDNTEMPGTLWEKGWTNTWLQYGLFEGWATTLKFVTPPSMMGVYIASRKQLGAPLGQQPQEAILGALPDAELFNILQFASLPDIPGLSGSCSKLSRAVVNVGDHLWQSIATSMFPEIITLRDEMSRKVPFRAMVKHQIALRPSTALRKARGDSTLWTFRFPDDETDGKPIIFTAMKSAMRCNVPTELEAKLRALQDRALNANKYDAVPLLIVVQDQSDGSACRFTLKRRSPYCFTDDDCGDRRNCCYYSGLFSTSVGETDEWYEPDHNIGWHITCDHVDRDNGKYGSHQLTLELVFDREGECFLEFQSREMHGNSCESSTEPWERRGSPTRMMRKWLKGRRFVNL